MNSHVFRQTVENKGMEIFEITPVILGGDPMDPANKVLLSRPQHIEAVRYWNRIIKQLRRERDGE